MRQRRQRGGMWRRRLGGDFGKKENGSRDYLAERGVKREPAKGVFTTIPKKKGGRRSRLCRLASNRGGNTSKRKIDSSTNGKKGVSRERAANV